MLKIEELESGAIKMEDFCEQQPRDILHIEYEPTDDPHLMITIKNQLFGTKVVCIKTRHIRAALNHFEPPARANQWEA